MKRKLYYDFFFFFSFLNYLQKTFTFFFKKSWFKLQIQNLYNFFIFITHLVRCLQLEHLDVTYREWISCLSSNSYRFLKRICQEHSFTAGQGFPQQWRLTQRFNDATICEGGRIMSLISLSPAVYGSFMSGLRSVSGWEQVSPCAWLQLWTVSDSYRQCQSKGDASHPVPSGWWKRWPHAKRHFQTSY